MQVGNLAACQLPKGAIYGLHIDGATMTNDDAKILTGAASISIIVKLSKNDTF